MLCFKLLMLTLICEIQGILFPVRTLKVSQCRATCIDELVRNLPSTQSDCSENESCYMCWESCHYLDVSNEMCDYDDFCHVECKKACTFYKQKENSIDQLKKAIKRIHDWKFDSPITFHAYTSEIILRWLPPQRQNTEDKTQHVNSIDTNSSRKRSVIVYSMLRKCHQKGQWELILETIDTITSLTSKDLCSKGATELRLLAVSQHGLLAQSSARYNGTLVPKKEPWKLYLLNMNINKANDTLEAVVVWSSLHAKGDFHVTWRDARSPNEVAGHLITEATIISIKPLEPRTVYVVEVLNEVTGDRSQPLLIDTKLDKSDYLHMLQNAVRVNTNAACTVGHLIIATSVIICVSTGLVLASIVVMRRWNRLILRQRGTIATGPTEKPGEWQELEPLNGVALNSPITITSNNDSAL